MTATPTYPPEHALIDGIGIDGSRYSVEFTVNGYIPNIQGVHVHFFFDTVPPEEAGIPADGGNWILYDRPSPFTGYLVSDRPNGATEMCILVAEFDHSVRLGTGNCLALPNR